MNPSLDKSSFADTRPDYLVSVVLADAADATRYREVLATAFRAFGAGIPVLGSGNSYTGSRGRREIQPECCAAGRSQYTHSASQCCRKLLMAQACWRDGSNR